MRTRLSGGLALIAFVVAAAAAGYGAQVSTLPDGRTMMVDVPAGPVRGVALLVPGGDTQLHIAPDGRPMPSGNFVIRTRAMWINAGFAIAFVSDPTDLREPIARLRPLGRPIVVVSTSRGTVVAAQNAAQLATAGPDLVVLTSPVTRGGPGPGESRPGIANSLSDVNVRPVSVPVLVVTNDRDSCNASPPEGAVTLARRFNPPAQLIHAASSQIRSAPCEAFSPHGYLGIEADVIEKIIAWVGAQRFLAPKP